MSLEYTAEAPSREAIDRQQGGLLLEFGVAWCPHCQAGAAVIDAALARRGGLLTHWRVEDGKGRRLGRTFGVKLWPTLIALRDGVEVARCVRPTSPVDLEPLLTALDLPLAGEDG